MQAGHHSDYSSQRQNRSQSVPCGIQMLLAVLFALVFSMQTGCDDSRPKTESHQQTPERAHLVNISASARSLLDQSIQRYRALRSYQDSAVVTLQYQLDGIPTIDQAPMELAWDRSGRLGLRIYKLSAGPDGSGYWHLRINDDRPEYAGQVISRREPEELTLDWLLHDPIVQQELASGPAGFPIQLDLLLNPEPLSGLLNHASSVRVGPTETISGRPCTSVVLEVGHLEYCIWFDQQTLLIRQLELPTNHLNDYVEAHPNIDKVRLVVELKEVRTNHAIHWDTWQVERRDHDHLVTHFVPGPPEIDLRGYNKSLPAFQLKDSTGSVRYDSRPQAQRRVSVLAWFADHPACKAVAQQLSVAQVSLKEMGIESESVEFVSIWAEPEPPQGLTFDQLKSDWNLPGHLVIDRDAAGRDLFQVQEAPTVILLDAEGRLQLRDVRTNPLLETALPGLVQQLLAGQNLAQQTLDEREVAEQRFQASLRLASSKEQPQQPFDDPVSYLPENFRLTETSHQFLSSPIQCLAQDSMHRVWALLADGNLHQMDASLESLAVYRTPWRSHDHQDLKLLPDPESRFFARSCREASGNLLRQVEILEAETGQSIRFDMPGDSSVAHLQWMTIPAGFNKSLQSSSTRGQRSTINGLSQSTISLKANGSKAGTNRLAVISNKGHLLMLDPKNHQQFSGTCPVAPVALLESASNGVGWAVLENGLLESLEMSGDDQPRSVSPPQTSPSLEDRHRFSFGPTAGPWNTVHTDSSIFHLAFGTLAKEEPAAFLLDSQLRTLWHYRLPVHCLTQWESLRIAEAVSPESGVAIWVILDIEGTIHIIRSDGPWVDHFRPEHPPSGIALIPWGDRLNLVLSAGNRVTAFQIH